MQGEGNGSRERRYGLKQSELETEIGKEFEKVQLGDKRLKKRLKELVKACSANPGEAFPQVLPRAKELKGAYRFFKNERVTYGALMAAHREQTKERAGQQGRVIVVHDTTEMVFQGQSPRRGLGKLRGKAQGFLVHFSLAVSGDGLRRPLGSLGWEPWVRRELGRSKQEGKKVSGSEYAKRTEKESTRWGRLIDQVNQTLGPGIEVIHVMDREADSYALFAHMIEQQSRFVVRLAHDRVTAQVGKGVVEKLRAQLARAEGVVQVSIPVAERKATSMPRSARAFGPRASRIATVHLSSTPVQLRRPPAVKTGPKWLAVQVVRAWEVDCPCGQKPIEWVLLTTEPVSTPHDLLSVMNLYRTRWLIEEFFKALKTGCALEKRQLESYPALLNALALFVPVAWQMLLLRHLAHNAPETPADHVLTEPQLQVLRACSPVRLSESPTVQQAFYAVAALGGHLKHNGQPGWFVLGRGMQQLLLLERGWSAAQRATKPP